MNTITSTDDFKEDKQVKQVSAPLKPLQTFKPLKIKKKIQHHLSAAQVHFLFNIYRFSFAFTYY